MLGLPGTGRTEFARPLREWALALPPAWAQPARQMLCLAAWLGAWAACSFMLGAAEHAPYVDGFASILTSAFVFAAAVWLLFAIACVELNLACVPLHDPGEAWLRRALRTAPAAGFATALVAGAFAAPLRFPASGYVAAALIAAVLVGLSSLRSRPRWPMLALVLGWSLHAAGIVSGGEAANAGDDSLPLDAHSAALAFLACTFAVAVQVARDGCRRVRRRQRDLIDSARRYRHVYCSAPVALLSVDSSGRVQRWNDLAGELFRDGLRQGQVNALGALLGESRAEALLARAMANGRYSGEERLVVGQAERIVDVDALLAADAIQISFVDVTERTLLARRFEHMAYHDPLTEQLNLRGLEREIVGIAGRVARGAPASLFHIDLHRFKAVNDVFGHAAGNSLVVEVARRIGAAVPPAARIARLGGDEFLVVLPDCPLEPARTIAQHALSMIVDAAYEVDGKRIRIQASMGLVELAPDMGVAEVIAYANAACREARRNHGSGIVAAQSSGEHLARYRAEAALGQRLRTSLPIERIAVFVQPIVPMRRPGREHASMAYETLLRERDEQGAILPPARLIAAAERHGAMPRVDLHMLETTLRQLDSQRPQAATIDFVTVNLSGASLNDERFLADVHALLRNSPEIAPRMCLEITESTAMFDVRGTRRFVEKMRSLGVRIALDDFGAGYSSFGYLRELPASLVKIDGQFMPGIEAQPRNQVIVSGIRRLVEELGMACIAEWVEDVATLEFLLRVDMDYAQGFALGRPLPIGRWFDEPVDLAPLHAARMRLAASRLETVRALRDASEQGRAARSRSADPYADAAAVEMRKAG